MGMTLSWNFSGKGGGANLWAVMSDGDVQAKFIEFNVSVNMLMTAAR